jgi:hypothetical protein
MGGVETQSNPVPALTLGYQVALMATVVNSMKQEIAETTCGAAGVNLPLACLESEFREDWAVPTGHPGS